MQGRYSHRDPKRSKLREGPFSVRLTRCREDLPFSTSGSRPTLDSSPTRETFRPNRDGVGRTVNSSNEIAVWFAGSRE